MKKNKLLKPKESLVNKFVILLLTFLTLFIFVIVVSYCRLTDYKELFNDITSKSIPKIVKSSNIYKQTNELIFLAEKLNNSKTQAFRRITLNQVKNKINTIKDLEKKYTRKNDYLINSLNVINEELLELNTLIKQKLILQNKIEEQNNKLFILNKNILSIKTEDKFSKTSNLWKITYSEIVNLSFKSLTLNKLNALKTNIKKIQVLNIKLKKTTDKLDDSIKSNFLIYYSNLQDIVLKKNSLLNLKTKQLKIKNKATAKENFVNNLIKDFSNQIEYISYQFLKNFIKKTEENSKEVSKQMNYMIILLFILLSYLIFLIYYLNKRIVSRLVLLNTYVKDKLLGKDKSFKDNFDDEISQITKTFNYYVQKVDEQKKLLEDLSLTDSLTNIPNRRAFDLEFDKNIKLAKRTDFSFSLFLLDIDFFKLYNDNYGHTAGDECLGQVSKLIKKTIKRELDFVGRYGGEEFVCILLNCNENEAKYMANKILENLNESNFSHKFSKISDRITLSIGITTIKNKNVKTSELLLNEADKALYYAKENGRNRFIHINDI